MQHVNKSAKAPGIKCSQEVHGSGGDVKAEFVKLMKCYTIYFAPGKDRGTGGLLTLVHNVLLEDVASTKTDIPVPGRFLRVNILYNNGSV
eukprot:129835-Karenia_brevis.AAC.1